MARHNDSRPEDGEPAPQSGLIEAAQEGKAKLCALFGGQGANNLTALNDLRDLVHRHGPTIETLIAIAAETLPDLASQPHRSGFHEDIGFDLQTWLDSPSRAPNPTHLALSPISFPLNTLLGLAQYCITCHSLELHPGQLRQLLCGVTGHSQGLFAAVAVSKADNWASFYGACSEALRLSFWVGLESHCAAPESTVSAAAVDDCSDRGEGSPSWMLSISGLDKHQLIELVETTNKSIADGNQAVHLALFNSRGRFILAGPPLSLRSVCVRLRQLKAPDGLDQTRTLAHKRKPAVDVHFLPVSAPYHSPYLTGVDVHVRESNLDIVLATSDLAIPVYHTESGQNLQLLETDDLVSVLVRAVTIKPVDWPRTTQNLTADGITHMLDFGPGQIGNLVVELTKGTGLRVIRVSEKPTSEGLTGRAELISKEMPAPSPNWKEMFSPRLVRDGYGHVQLQTKMTTVFGAPPVMVAGMTPTTVHWDFVAAVMDAGYHIELAGGGYWEEKAMEAAIRRLAATIPPGRGITCNLLYANPKTIAWQISLLRRLASDGVPIDGITIGAGIPSPEIIHQYISSIPGLRHISFKPGSLAGIHQVIALATAHPHFTIGLQWTGGRAGGHHSWEDFHQPILATYAQIRKHPNIILIAGSGFGGAEDTLPFLTGEWAHAFGYTYPAPMPFDGVLLGSRMMVAREAHTAPQAKRLIIDAPGVEDAEWHGSFEKPTGGVVTVESEMGQPIHVLATRGMRLWRELDRRVFSIRDLVGRVEYLRVHREEVRERLNGDFFRPWFAVDGDGRNIEIADMTYAQVLRRLCELMYVRPQDRWIDESYRVLVHDYVRLSHERFGRADDLWPHERCPDVVQQAFEHSLGPEAHEKLYPDDVSLLVALFRRPGQKPVPFIPQLDEHFETWFKKDSLWQSEDVDAVVGQDADRVCVIQGPVAAQYSTTCEESAKDILDGICGAHVRMLQDRGMEVAPADRSQVIANRLGGIAGVQIREDGLTLRYELGGDYTPNDLKALVDHITRGAGAWAKACLTSDWIFRGRSRVANPIKAAFRLLPGDTIDVRRQNCDSVPEETIFVTRNRPYSDEQSSMSIALKQQHYVCVKLTPLMSRGENVPQAQFLLELLPGPAGLTLYEKPCAHIQSVKTLYSELWLGGPDPLSPCQAAGLSSEFSGEETVITRDDVNAYLDVLCRDSTTRLHGWNPRGAVPIDYCVVLAWTALTKPLMIPALDCNLLQLLHRSVHLRYVPDARLLHLCDTVKAFSRITALASKPGGTLIHISADIRRGDERVATIQTEFFIRGATGNRENQFSSVQEPELWVPVATPVIRALLLSRKWLLFEERCPDIMGQELSFQLTTHTVFDDDGNIALSQVSGTVSASARHGTGCPIRVGRVYFEKEPSSGNPVIDFLRRHGGPRSVRHQLDQPGWTGPSTIMTQAPSQSASYSLVSRDRNPIHTCPLFARYAGLEGVVVHGMHTSAIVRRAVEWALGDADRTRFRGWKASFEAMVRHNDRLRVEMLHIAMENGRMVIQVTTFNDQTGEKVLEAEAEVEQPRAGYVFCGQGSQEKGMGMVLYDARPEAKALWDRAETYFREQYGFSILHIVRENPKSVTVHFAGQRGRRIRDKYLAMARRVSVPGGGDRDEPILTGLTPSSKSYTFSYPKGLLMSTQFSQPALALMDMAEYAHLQARGVVQAGARFAGHSLGEYAALGACTSFMPFESLLSLIYYRGIKMQNALPRDADGRTDYSMVAADPSRIGPEFDEQCFQNLVHLIADETQLLLEVVNYNIRSQQYVCAGHYIPLQILTSLTDTLANHPSPHTLPPSHLISQIRALIHATSRLSNADPLPRGRATIPLTGIDIPFHSTALRGQIDDYRQYLAQSVRAEDIRPDELVGKWIPNVVGEVFGTGRGFVERVWRVTGSEVLRGLVEEMRVADMEGVKEGVEG